MSEKEFLKNYRIHDYDVPLSTVDMTIFSLVDGELNVLLVRRDNYPFKDTWALPGGFINLKKDGSIEAAAHRTLKEKTGLLSAYLEQIETIGSPKRDPRGWSLTVLYFALVDISKTTYTALPIELMPSEFTLTELQTVFEMILGKKLQPKSFRNRVISANMVEETGNSKISGKRPAKLYRSTNNDRDTYFSRSLQD